LCLCFLFYFSFIETWDRNTYTQDYHKKYSQYETNKKYVFVNTRYKIRESWTWRYAAFISSHLIGSVPDASWWFSEFAWLTGNRTYFSWCSKVCIWPIETCIILCKHRETRRSKDQ
jgi:hypothetical protein